MNVGGITLHLRGEVRDILMDWLRSYRPDLMPRYEGLYGRGAYVGKTERERIQALLRQGPGGRNGEVLRNPGRARIRSRCPSCRPPRAAGADGCSRRPVCEDGLPALRRPPARRT